MPQHGSHVINIQIIQRTTPLRKAFIINFHVGIITAWCVTIETPVNNYPSVKMMYIIYVVLFLVIFEGSKISIFQRYNIPFK